MLSSYISTRPCCSLANTGRDEESPLHWVVESGPGQLIIAAGLSNSQRAFSGSDLGHLAFVRLSGEQTGVRTNGALIYADGQTHIPAFVSTLSVGSLPETFVLYQLIPTRLTQKRRSHFTRQSRPAFPFGSMIFWDGPCGRCLPTAFPRATTTSFGTEWTTMDVRQVRACIWCRCDPLHGDKYKKSRC